MTKQPVQPLSAKAIYFAALNLFEPQERRKYVEEVCNGNIQLRTEVERLLQENESGRSNLLSNAVRQLVPHADGDLPLTSGNPTPDMGARLIARHPVIDRYKILEEIGRGGMGTVFMAQQLEPVKRRVALKVINPGMDSREVIARFEAERQALAMMDHPNIARVFDGGTTVQGRPYFVMELVRGVPITEYCERKKVSLQDRLQLFVDVCQAVQHAHQKGIIHRDLKPSNVQITNHDDKPVVKVIDFGVAKALHQELTERTLYTQFSQLVGTPLYMSPEQADRHGLDIDTRSDIYALGVLLYELLTGTTPFDREELSKAGIDGARRMICEVEPPRPSVRLSTLQAAEDSTLEVAREQAVRRRKLSLALRGDLDWIVMKCLEKDRNRRYESASALGQDLERHLDHEPIEAKPPTPLTRFTKWSRRHEALVWSLLTILFLAAISLGFSTAAINSSRNIAEEARDNAESEREQAEQARREAIEQRNIARRNQYFAEMVAGNQQAAGENPGGLYGRLVEYLPLRDEVDLRDWEWYYLLSLCKPEDRTIAHPFRYPFSSWSPDGQLIGAPGALWQADTGEGMRRFSTSFIKRGRVDWSPDGQKFAWAAVSDEDAFYIWDRATDKLSRFAGHESSAWCVAWNPDGTRIASGSTDNTIRVWDPDSQQELWSVKTPHHVMSLDWSSDGKLLAAGLHWYGVQVWDVSRQEPVALVKHGGNRHLVSWHPQGGQLAVSEDDRWYLWDQIKADIVVEHKLRRGQAIDYSPDGSQIAVADGETIAIWDSAGEQQLQNITGHLSPITSVAWSPEGGRLVSSDETEIKIWSLAKLGRQSYSFSFEDSIESLNWMPDNTALEICSRADNSLQRWNTATGTIQERTPLRVQSDYELGTLEKLAVVHIPEDHALEISDLVSGEPQAVLPLDPSNTYYCCTLSRDNRLAAVQSEGNGLLKIETWDIGREQRLWTWTCPRAKTASGSYHISRLHHPVWSSNGAYFAAFGTGDLGENGSTYWDDHLHLFDAKRGIRLVRHIVAAGRDSVTTAAWSPDSSKIAFGAKDGRVEVVDVASKRGVFEVKIHQEGITSIAWHPRGNRLACGTANGSVKLISTEAGQILLELPLSRPSSINYLAWSNDGQRLAAASVERIHVLDASDAYSISADGSRRGELAWAYRYRAVDAPQEIRDAALREFIRLAPDNLSFWHQRGEVYGRLGLYDRACEEFAKEIKPDLTYSLDPARLRTYALLGAKQTDKFQNACAELVEVFSESPIASNQGYVAKLCAITSQSFVDHEVLVSMAKKNLEDYPADSSQLTFGACLLRAGQTDQAIEVLTAFADSLERGGDYIDQFHSVCARYLLAIARQHKGHNIQAKRILGEANELAEELPEDEFFRLWYYRVELETLRREAERLIALD